MKTVLKRSFLISLCVIILVSTLYSYSLKPKQIPSKVYAAEWVAAGYVVEEIIYFLLTAVAATLGICLIEEAEPMLQDLYNGFLDDYQDKLDSGVIVDDKEPQVQVGGFVIWKNTLDELERMDDLMFGSGGNGKKPPTDPDDQDDEIIEIKEYMKSLDMEDTILINGAFLGSLTDYLKSVMTPDSSIDSVVEYYTAYGQNLLYSADGDPINVTYDTSENNVSADRYLTQTSHTQMCDET